jgi:hypothetical protein
VRRSKLLFGAAVAALVGVSGVAHAAHLGVYIGGGVPYYYPVAPVPYYYGAPVVVAPPPPPQAPDYIEQGQTQGAMPQQEAQGPAAPQGDAAGGEQQGSGDTWYYCDESKTYYPYVKECSSGWRAVPAQPAPSN